MTTLIDTHSHLYDQQFDADRETVVQRALDSGVEKMLLPNCDRNTLPKMLDMAAKWPRHCLPMLGLHPCYVDAQYEIALAEMEKLHHRQPWVAVGEIGLDFHWDTQFAEAQKRAFERQIDWALDMQLPVVIHTRKALSEAIEIVAKKQNGKLRGVFHCFGGDVAEATAITDLGFVLGIGGVVTFKNSSLSGVLQVIGLEHLVLETDAPYLAPVPYRGKRNESSYIRLIAGHIADTLGISPAEVAETTTRNARTLFKLMEDYENT